MASDKENVEFNRDVIDPQVFI